MNTGHGRQATECPNQVSETATFSIRTQRDGFIHRQCIYIYMHTHPPHTHKSHIQRSHILSLAQLVYLSHHNNIIFEGMTKFEISVKNKKYNTCYPSCFFFSLGGPV